MSSDTGRWNFLFSNQERTNQVRGFIKRDVEILLQIKRLLYNERYTIEGVRKRLGTIHIRAVDSDSEVKTAEVQNPSKVIKHVKKRLREIPAWLGQPPG